MKRILLADDNHTPRSALALLLEARLGARIVGQVSSMESLLCEAAATLPDIIILDWELPGAPRPGRIAALRQTSPRSRIIVSSARPESASQVADADAFFYKTDPPEVILRVIQGN